MGLSRASSGLLLFDDFSSDTKANYTESGGDGANWAVSGGLFTHTAAGTDSFMRRADIATAKCFTARAKEAVVAGDYTSFCVGGSGLGSGAYAIMPNGYAVWTEVSATTTGLACTNGATQTILATPSTASRSNNTLYIWRIYIAAGHVIVKFGATTLSAVANVADGTFSDGQVAVGDYTTSSFDWLDARTAHSITCALPAGWYLKVSDGTTTAKAASSAGTATVDAGLVLFPLTRVSVYAGDPDAGGIEIAYLTNAALSDMGGGDVFAYAPTLTASQVASDIVVGWS